MSRSIFAPHVGHFTLRMYLKISIGTKLPKIASASLSQAALDSGWSFTAGPYISTTNGIAKRNIARDVMNISRWKKINI